MNLEAGFTYNPNPSPAPAPQPAPTPSDLGLLAGLVGKWSGTGFNTIWRPNAVSSGQDRFLELNLTQETLEFDEVPGGIPNRGLLQGDLTMTGLRYLQQISDANLPASNNGLHIEPGIWLNVPATTDPLVSASVARLASIPHGTTILAQGVASQASSAPILPAININPFSIGNPSAATPFPEQNLGSTTQFRTSGQALTGITQAMVDDPNSVLNSALAGVTATITLSVASNDLPTPGGGTINTAFLVGGSGGPNANAAAVTATFWLETVGGSATPNQLQYSQTVLLNFNGLSWPHVTVATLKPAAS